jgi:glycosidase
MHSEYRLIAKRVCWIMAALCGSILALEQSCPAQLSESTSRPPVRPGSSYPWYVTAAAIHRVSLKPNTQFWRFEHLSLDSTETERQLLEWKTEGIDAIEVFAPEEGGNSYDGLDAKNRYALDPGLGTMADFRRLVGQVHSKQMHIVTFQNLGYAALDAGQFQKAEQDVRAGQASRESQFFFWSSSKDAPPPAQGDSYFFVRPIKPGYDPMKKEIWQWSEAAQRYYWTRWTGKDAHGDTTHLPHYNWIANAWPEEANHVIDFWMATGLDGMVVDAVNWYTGYDWQKNAKLLAKYRKYHGSKLLVPEGGGAFHTDDPVGWIKDGTWPALYDYGLDIWWEEQSRPMRDSIQQGDPALFEDALRRYHDRVVAAGGVLIQPVLKMTDDGKQRLEEALLATSGDMLCYCEPVNSILRPASGIPDLLRLKVRHPALYQNSTRRRIATDHDQSAYATVRDAADGSERLLVVFNFSPETLLVAVDTRAVRGFAYRDLESNQAQQSAGAKLELELPGYGHRVFLVEDRQILRTEENR